MRFVELRADGECEVDNSFALQGSRNPTETPRRGGRRSLGDLGQAVEEESADIGAVCHRQAIEFGQDREAVLFRPVNQAADRDVLEDRTYEQVLDGPVCGCRAHRQQRCGDMSAAECA